MVNNLKELIKKSNLPLSEISRQTGISASTIYRYANGQIKNIKSDYYDMIVSVLNKNNQEMCLENNENCTTDINTDLLKKDMMSNGIKQNEYEMTLVNSNNVHNNFYKNINTNKYPKRGDIYYVKNNNATGNEVWGSRLAVIVSSNKLNQIMGTVEVVYVTSQPKADLPCHCTIKTEKAVSVVLCEQINSVSKSRLGNYMGTVTDIEMQVIEKALRVSLDLKLPAVREEFSTDYIMLQTERNFYKQFYDHVMKVWMIKSTTSDNSHMFE
jgi:mRNA interferase MazF